MDPVIIAPSRLVTDPADCNFYHSIDLPSGSQAGQCDLRGRFDDYTGHVPLDGRTVLDVGTATGFLTFEAEKRGATVTSFDAVHASLIFELPISGNLFVDNHPAWVESAEPWLERMKNGYWLCHRELGSSADCVYGDVYELSPETIGVFDVVLVGQILIHLRDGLSALAGAASVCRETLVVTEGSFDDPSPVARLSGRAHRPEVAYAWYQYSHGWYREVLAMLGFRDVKITTDRYLCNEPSHERVLELATVVASR
jgi:SAM-dependent methyltransferase